MPDTMPGIMRNVLGMIGAELFLLRKRTSTWALLGIWAAVTLFFSYLLPYLSYRGDTGSDFDESLDSMLPGRFVQTMAEGLPFYAGSIVLILGVLSFGSEFGWGTWKTMLTQRAGRSQVFGAKIAALGIALVPALLLIFTLGALSSVVVAALEGASMSFPSVADIGQALLSGWLILAVWTAGGVALAMATRGTALAIGIGILWGLFIEGLIGVFAAGISWLEWLVDLLLRANGYSLIKPLEQGATLSTDGPGIFTGPYVSATQAALVLAVYLALFLGGSLLLLRRRDIV
jgi:ABC-type transport system involved in multi-copper enzyme maturation permease subunit